MGQFVATIDRKITDRVAMFGILREANLVLSQVTSNEPLAIILVLSDIGKVYERS